MTASGRGTGGASTGGDASKVPRPIAAGPEMKALGRFYRDLTGKGVIREGGMGPGTSGDGPWFLIEEYTMTT